MSAVDTGGLWPELGAAAAMWCGMTAVMMLPVAIPSILAFRRITGEEEGGRQRTTAMFLGGYGVVWGGFILAAAAVQVTLSRGRLLVEGGALPGTIGGGVLAGAGAFQLTPLKYACLSRCRSPMATLLTRWRDGPTGALVMGAHYGRYCLGCCWALMLAAFSLGVMNLVWMGVLTAVMALEKVSPAGPALGRVAGLLALAAGSWMILSG